MTKAEAKSIKEAAQKWVQAEIFFSHAVHVGFSSQDLRDASDDTRQAHAAFEKALADRTVDDE